MAAALFVISSPSGGGKTTVAKELCQRMPDLGRSISFTTREPRVGEKDGVDYRFVSIREFEQMKSEGKLLEWASVHDAYYGTPKEPIEKLIAAGKSVVLCIDVQGARAIKEEVPDSAVLIFLMPPSVEALSERLKNRSTETETSLQIRLAAAREEMACASWYDHEVVNDELNHAVEQIEAIIQKAHYLKESN